MQITEIQRKGMYIKSWRTGRTHNASAKPEVCTDCRSAHFNICDSDI